jgi:hypothetical protein
MSITPNRSLAVMKLPKAVPALLRFAAALLAALTGNALIPNAAAILAALAKALTGAGNAETATKTRAAGTVAARNAAITGLVSELHVAKAFVQQTADADPENAEAIIASAGLVIRKATTHHKAPFTATQGATSGTVKLMAKSVAVRASYDWQWSADGGKTWTELPSTLQAKTTLTGVAVGTMPLFRFRSVTKVGESDWSLPTSVFVK